MSLRRSVRSGVVRGLKRLKRHLEDEVEPEAAVSSPDGAVFEDAVEVVHAAASGAPERPVNGHGYADDAGVDVGGLGEPDGIDEADEVDEQRMLDEWSATLQAELESLGREVKEAQAEVMGDSTLGLNDDPTDEVPIPTPPRITEPLSDADRERISTEAVDLVRTVFDPEIPVDIYELGLIYGIDVLDERDVMVTMTLTSPNCPAAQSLPAEVEQKLATIVGVNRVAVDITFDPPWDPTKMSEAARLELNLF